MQIINDTRFNTHNIYTNYTNIRKGSEKIYFNREARVRRSYFI